MGGIILHTGTAMAAFHLSLYFFWPSVLREIENAVASFLSLMQTKGFLHAANHVHQAILFNIAEVRIEDVTAYLPVLKVVIDDASKSFSGQCALSVIGAVLFLASLETIRILWIIGVYTVGLAKSFAGVNTRRL